MNPTRGRTPRGSGRAEVVYDIIRRSPLGTIYLAGGPRGLIAVGIDTTERAFVRRVLGMTGEMPVRSAGRMREPARQVLDLLRGRRKTFALPLDLAALSSFQRAVLQGTRRIPRGRVVAYGELAKRLGRPRAGRAVGQALARNPLPLVIPCHRVVAADGALRGFLGHRTPLKANLLELEGVRVRGGCRLAPPASRRRS